MPAGPNRFMSNHESTADTTSDDAAIVTGVRVSRSA